MTDIAEIIKNLSSLPEVNAAPETSSGQLHYLSEPGSTENDNAVTTDYTAESCHYVDSMIITAGLDDAQIDVIGVDARPISDS